MDDPQNAPDIVSDYAPVGQRMWAQASTRLPTSLNSSSSSSLSSYLFSSFTLSSSSSSSSTSTTLIFLTLQSLLLCRHRRVARFFYLPFFCVCDFPLPSRLWRKSEKSVKLCKKFFKALAKPLQNGNNYEVAGNSHKSENTKKSLMIEF